jgi:hypothetical protein
MTRALLLAGSMAVTFIVMRAYLHWSPNTDLNVAGYDVHHLFTGLVLLTAAGVPALLLPAAHRLALPALALFGVGLALALDEWLYLIVTDGTNASYITPVSFWGGLAAVTGASFYAVLIGSIAQRLPTAGSAGTTTMRRGKP